MTFILLFILIWTVLGLGYIGIFRLLTGRMPKSKDDPPEKKHFKPQY